MIYTILVAIILATLLLLALSIGYIAVKPESIYITAIARFLVFSTVVECGLLVWIFLFFGV